MLSIEHKCVIISQNTAFLPKKNKKINPENGFSAENAIKKERNRLKKTFKKVLSVFLVLVMLIGFVPAADFAGLDVTGFFATMVAKAVGASGTCGTNATKDNVVWELTEDGELIISGDGAMASFGHHSYQPWANYRDAIVSVTVSSGVTNIGDLAFTYLDKLASATIADTVITIGNSAFNGCTSLAKIAVPAKVVTIGDSAFHGCSSLANVTLSSSVKSIGNYAFQGCSSLAKIVIPDSVNSIGNYAFYGCSSLASVTLSDNITVINQDTFQNCSALAKITLPEGITTIGARAFLGCSGLARITIPDNVATIGERAFSGCTGMATVSLGEGLLKISDGAFNGCTSLGRVVIPDGVTSIGQNSFRNCTTLSSVTLGSEVTKIDQYAFQGCSSLATVNFSENLTSIGNNAFCDCISLTKAILPDSVTTIGDYAFNNCTALTTADLGDGLTKIPQFAFYGCSALKNLTIGENVTSIGDYAFSGCSALVSVVIPDGVTNIGSWAFRDCTAMSSLIIGENVTNIGTGAFYNCGSIASLTIGESVTNIGDNAFYGCKSLINVTIPDSTTAIGVRAFEECTSLANLHLGSELAKIGDYAFRKCTSLKAVVIPESVTNIGTFAFTSCSALQSYTVDTDNAAYSSDSNGVLFNEDKSVLISYPAGNSRKSYIIPSTVSTIDKYAFYQASYLTTVDAMSSELAVIKDNAFSYCSSLNEIFLPKSLSSVESYAFTTGYSTPVLATVHYEGSEEEWADVSIQSQNNALTSAPKCYNCPHPGVNPVNEFTVSYSYVGEIPAGVPALPADATYKINDVVTVAEKPTLTGYTFEGWYYNGAKVESFTMPSANVNLTGKWTKEAEAEYDVKYAYTGDVPAGAPALPSDKSAFAGDRVSLSATPVLEGYTFHGWYYNGTKVTSFVMPEQDVVITGYWELIPEPEYTLTFDANGGVFADGTTKKTVKYTYGASIDNYFEAPAREGYVFVRWDIIPATMPDHDITVKAEWERIPEPENVAYTVTILEENVDGETYTVVETYARTAPEGTTVSVTPEERTGFTVDVEASNLSEVLVIGYMTDLCVVYDRNEYTFTVDANGGKFADGTSKKTVKYLYGATVSTPETPSKEGYDFVSWSNAVPSKMPANNVVVNAVWNVAETPGCGHTETTVVTIPATCKVAGMKYSVCVECGETVGVPEVLPVIPHTIVTVVSVEPTCTREGKEYDKCSACGDRIGAERTIAKLPHTPGEWETVTEPTCTTEGEKVQKCTVCGLIIDTETIPVKPHTPGAWVTETEPTCTSEGKKVKKCTVCSEILDTITLDPLPHTPGEWVTVTEPTGTSEGKKVQKCTVCGTVLAEQIIPKNEVLKDDETGIEIEYPDGSQGDNVAIVVEESFDGSAFNLIDTKTDATQSFIYDIKMTVNGYETQPQGAVTVRIPLPEGYDANRSFIYHVNTETGKVEKMNASVETINGKKYLVFETTHFSYYAVVEEGLVKVEIRNPSITTINYGDSIILHADTSNLPAGYTVKWTADNGNFSYNANGATCTINPEKSGDTTFTATVYDANGNEVSSDTQKMTSKAGFFQKIIAFFKGLFGLNKTYPQAF